MTGEGDVDQPVQKKTAPSKGVEIRPSDPMGLDLTPPPVREPFGKKTLRKLSGK